MTMMYFELHPGYYSLAIFLLNYLIVKLKYRKNLECGQFADVNSQPNGRRLAKFDLSNMYVVYDQGTAKITLNPF